MRRDRPPRPLPALREVCGTPNVEASVLGDGPDPFVSIAGGWLRLRFPERADAGETD